MATMVSEIYDAFVEAGASQDKARKAAEAVAGLEGRGVKLEHETGTSINDLKREIVGLRGEFTALRGEVMMQRWILGVVLAMQAAVLVRLFVS